MQRSISKPADASANPAIGQTSRRVGSGFLGEGKPFFERTGELRSGAQNQAYLKLRRVFVRHVGRPLALKVALDASLS